MKTKLNCHVFICTNCTYEEDQKTIGPSNQLRDEAKDLAKSKWDKSKVRINKSGCLGRCEEGVAAVIYPQEKWLTGLKQTDSEKVVSEIQKLLD